ncbi:MAG: DUF922 domain-containing protein [Bacteroidetes bacterium]|nr:DUF922 domain-containing protein [Bacteroidota bacterium]
MNFYLIVLTLLFQTIPLNIEKEKILWSESYKLSWADFQAKPNIGSGFVASTNSGISFSYSFSYSEEKGDFDLDFTIQSNFYPTLSWYIASEVTENTLKHEQTHFDISELHARLLRKKISETIFSKNIKKEMDTFYNTIENMRKEMQLRFDNETDHSNIRNKELEWEEFVARQLKAFAKWK